MFTAYTYGRLFCFISIRIVRMIFDAYCVSRYRAYSKLIAKLDGDIESCISLIRYLKDTKVEADRSCQELRLKHREAQLLCHTVPSEYNAEIEGLLLVATRRREEVERLRANTIQNIFVAEDRLNRLQGERSLLVHLRKQIPVPAAHFRKR